MLTGIALDCEIKTEAVRFERKNYFYPDLPKGYQISQYALPLAANGRLEVPVPAEDKTISIGITRAHLEEDTARLQHGGKTYSLLDFNRAGVPLMEIVTEPDVRSPAQARAYGETLRDILRYIGASDGDMETGSMRIEGNVSLRPIGTDAFGTKVEVKNLNSFRSPRACHGVRGRAPGRCPRARRAAHPGDARLARDRGADDQPALQGRGERLSLLPRARSAPAATVGGVGGAAAREPARSCRQRVGRGTSRGTDCRRMTPGC